MRLPWWPIYIDAEMDEQGVRYTTPDGVEHHAQWHLLTYPDGPRVKSCFSIVDEDLRIIRYGRVRIVLRLPDATPDADTLRQHFIEHEEYELTITDRPNRSARFVSVFFPLYLMVLPAMLLIVAFPGSPVPIADNQLGDRVRNAIALLLVMALLGCVLLIGVAIHNWTKGRHAAVLRAVTRNSIKVKDASDDERVIPKDQLLHKSISWGMLTLRTDRNERIIVPKNRCVYRLIQIGSQQQLNHSMSIPFVIGFSVITLGLGPFTYAWHRYLIPDDPNPPPFGAYVFVSFFGPVLLAMLYTLIHWSNRSEKRKRSKSQ